ncbi:MAG: hypothetical protein U5J95_01770 [Balneolaceae bacterium]|nr:hypothetical protein [Balneolaceae bacterium]
MNTSKLYYGFVLLLLALIGIPGQSQSQDTKSYELLPAPDLWYNDVDGIRAGLRLKGQVPGTFDDGPHRLDFGVWLGTWFPDYPVSYYVSFTEPIPSISDFGSEGNIQLISSMRTGFHNHGVAFNKRWQTGFEERNYKELTINARFEDRFENEYLLYPQLWSPGNLFLVGLNFDLRNENGLGRYSLITENAINVGGENPSFVTGTLDLQQHIPLGEYFDFRIRTFWGASTNNAPAQYLFSHSFKPAINWMNSGLTRAKGTIPTPWMEEGIFQIAGGANLRGYLGQNFDVLNTGAAPLVNSIGAVNLEADYPNPLDRAIQKIPVLGGIMQLRSYLFFDSGTSLGIVNSGSGKLLSDAGLGFMLSINIPDYLGKDRGIKIRYDIPAWLSNPAGSNNFKYRSIIGIGAVIDL